MQARENLRAARRRRAKLDRLRKTAGGVMAIAGIVLLSADISLMSVNDFKKLGLTAFALMIVGATLAGAWICQTE